MFTPSRNTGGVPSSHKDWFQYRYVYSQGSAQRAWPHCTLGFNMFTPKVDLWFHYYHYQDEFLVPACLLPEKMASMAIPYPWFQYVYSQAKYCGLGHTIPHLVSSAKLTVRIQTFLQTFLHHCYTKNGQTLAL